MSYHTNTPINRAANELVGVLKEKATLASVYFTDIERAVVKATNLDVVAPKAKHVRSMLLQREFF